MYRFYRETYHGSGLSREEFPRFFARAQDYLAQLKTTCTVQGSEEAEAMALCAIADAMAYYDAARNGQGGLRYASVGTVSVSGKGVYSAVDISPAAQQRELYRRAMRYLSIYRGCGG